jgi:gluconokinase
MTPPAEGRLVLTLDIGTSSTRALVFDARARALPGLEARASYAMRTTSDGGVDGDPAEILAKTERVIDEVLAGLGPRAATIGAVACCTFWHSLIGLGRGGLPLTPMYTWGDTRSEREWRELRRRLDEKAFHQRTGTFFHPCYHPAKLRWLRKTRPGVFDAVERWLSFGEYLYLRLFGSALATFSMASACGLMDVREGRYDAEILKELGIPESKLSPLGDVNEAFRGLREPYAARWPALKEVPWTPPVGDGACNNLGSGCTGPDRLGVMIGTSGAMRVVTGPVPKSIPKGVFCYRADRNRALLGGALSDGGNLVEWIRTTFQVGDLAAAEAEMERMEPDGHGLTFLPFLAGERAPGYAADARALIGGLRLNTKPAEVLRAGLEAVALRFALIRFLIEPAVPGIREVVASGGGFLKSPLWVQILADAMGIPITASTEPEAGCRGAALLTMEALGWIPRLEDLPAATGRTMEPDPKRTAAYAAALERQQAWYAKMLDLSGPGGR